MLLCYMLICLSLIGSLASSLQGHIKKADGVDCTTEVNTILFTSTQSPVPIINRTLEEVIYFTAAPVIVTVTQLIGPFESSLGSITPSANNVLSNDSHNAPTKIPLLSMSSAKVAQHPSLTGYSPGHKATSSHMTKTSSMSTSVTPVSLSVASSTSFSLPVTPIDQDLPTNTMVQNLQPSDIVFNDLALFAHNVHRANHTDTVPLKYNMTLEQIAREKVLSCIWDETIPNDVPDIGMNMAEGTFIGAANVTSTVGDMWYNDEINLFPGYDIANPDMDEFQDWGHFSQIVWRATTSVGCWSAPCSREDGTKNAIGAGFFTVCTYFPPGNIGGEYDKQIGRPDGQPTIHGI